MPPDSCPVTVREAAVDDIGVIQSIYAHEVLTGVATFEEIPPSVEEMNKRRESVLSFGLPYLIATINDDIVGYSYATEYRARPAYRYTIESSVYVATGHHRQGIGRMLMSALIERCEEGPSRQMIAVIGDSANAGSIALHKALGFRFVGTLVGSGFKHGRWVDTVLMQRALGAGAHRLPIDQFER